MKALFLDAGLTLLRAHPSLGGVYTGVTRRFGREVPPEDFNVAAASAFHAQAREHRETGEEGLRTSDDLERESWRRHAHRVMDALPAMQGMDFDAWFEDLYADFGSSAVWRPYDDVVPALERFRALGLRLAVVSNWDSRLRAILDESGLRPWFDEVVISSEVGWRKPHPAIFKAALAGMGVKPGEVLHVGDSVGDDLDGAAGCGIGAVLIDREGERAAPEGFSVIRDLRDVEGWLS